MAEFFSLQDLIDVLEEQINIIRNSSSNYKELKRNIKNLKGYMKDLTQIENASFVYHQLITISLQIRQLLSDLIPEEQQYSNVGYAFYYKGKRYYTGTIDNSWLTVRGVEGQKELYISLARAVKDIEKAIQKTIYVEINEVFSQHYNLYKQYIEGMYQQQNKHEVGDLKLNYGHIAEAHEWHLQDKHKELYNKSLINDYNNISDLRSAQLTSEERTMLDKMKKCQRIGEEMGPYEAWSYIHSAMGTQRGTVAGDARQAQVKQVKEDGKSSTSLSLSTLSNLLLGFNIYSGIFTNKDSRLVATEIAMYIASFLDNRIAAPVNRHYLQELVTTEEINVEKLAKVFETKITL